MNKNAIKKYAVWARRELIARVSQKALQYGITADGKADPNADSVNGRLLSDTEKKQRQALIRKVNEQGYEQVMEEVAYTWFNRFAALRFMEVNGYLPSHVRVFTNDEGEFKPQILSEAIHLDLDGLNMDKVYELKNANKDEELFKYLLIVQCNALNKILPGMFQRIEDFTELLLPDYLLREGSVIEKMISEISEDNFDVSSEDGQIEIIGWLYQYYISEKHEEVIDPIHGKVVKKEEVPAATQLFTTDWVVRYLIDNSVGRYWIERNPGSMLADKLTYFVKPKDGTIKTVNEKITPQDVTTFDPCVGSGHFLIYAFDVLMKIYVEYGYSERDAASEIVKNNLFGLDIDGRASQLAYFSVMMKARQYDRRFFSRNIQPHIFEITESNTADRRSIEYFCGSDASLKKDIKTLLDTLKDAKEYGSILQMPTVDFGKTNERLAQLGDEISIYNTYLLGDFQAMIRPAEIMSGKYAVVATNPPYLNKYDIRLKKFVFDNYKDFSGDLFSVFMIRNFGFCKKDGYSAFMTPNVWMFIISYEKLRKYILSNKDIVTLVQMAKGAFFKEATVDVCSFVLKNGKLSDGGLYVRLDDFRGGMEIQGQKLLDAINDPACGYYYETQQQKFDVVPGSPIAFWVSESIFKDFLNSKLYVKDYSNGEGKNVTTNNAKYILFYWEVSTTHIGAFDFKWLPCATGGDYRKWYGNIVNVIDWSKGAREFYKRTPAGRIIREEFWPMTGLTWGKISSGSSSFRVLGRNQIYQETAILQRDESKTAIILALLNSCVSEEFLKFLSPTVNFQLQDICTIPIMDAVFDNDEIIELCNDCIEIAKADWDSFEISMDFKKHPLVAYAYCLEEDYRSSIVELMFNYWNEITTKRFFDLKQNEEKLNRIFIDIYGLQDELTPEVEDKDVTVRKADLQREIRSLISYAVGCMFGRYSLDVSGLAYAGGTWDASQYKTFQPDRDAIIPICDDEYFEDDIVGLFVKFIEVVYGKETLEENLQFIADTFGGKGVSREVIRNYFMNDFYKDHCKIYQKRPIYWLFDSGKKNGFKCLIYMHRYQPDTIARIRTDYVHEQQSRYRTAIADLEQHISGASGAERIKLNKQLTKLQAQATEIREYEEKIHHLADQMISIDLDDGVKVNYAKFQDVLAKIK